MARNVAPMPGAVPGAKLCRMCGTSQKKPTKEKVSVLRKDLDTLPVLDLCLDLGSPANALLPDGVCEACISMVRIITRFARSCWDAQDLLIERYAPGKAGKVEPWKRVAGCPEKAKVDDPLRGVEEVVGETELLTPKKETQEISAPEDDQQPVIEPVETTEPPKQPYKPPKTSKSKPSKPSSAEPSAKRPRSSEGSAAVIQPLHGCDFCMQKFATKKLLDQHIRTHVRNLHQAEKKRFLAVDKFHCLRCRAQFSQAEQLKQHFATMHQD